MVVRKPVKIIKVNNIGLSRVTTVWFMKTYNNFLKNFSRTIQNINLYFEPKKIDKKKCMTNIPEIRTTRLVQFWFKLCQFTNGIMKC